MQNNVIKVELRNYAPRLDFQSGFLFFSSLGAYVSLLNLYDVIIHIRQACSNSSLAVMF